MDFVPLWLLVVGAGVAIGTLAMTVRNLRRFGRSDAEAPLPGEPPLVSVCLPVRNEAANLEACVRSVAAGDWPRLEVLVYDDQSDDDTPVILARLARECARVRVVPTRPLPPAWVGKQWACEQLGRAALGEWLLFIDADVRLSEDAVRRALAAADRRGADLVSTFPRQLTGSFGEAMLVPMIHFILLSYLPFGRMRRTNDPAASAGCGQFLLVRAEAYRASGGHAPFRASMHDGIRMPRALRRAGFRTDLFDGTDVAWCRMYRGTRAAWRGFAKNAFEGLGSAALLVLLSVLHLVGHVLPWAYLGAGAATRELPTPHALAAGVAVAAAVAQRLLLAYRFEQPLLGVVLHPVAVLMMTAVQWHSFILSLTGRRVWRGRAFDAAEPSPSRG